MTASVMDHPYREFEHAGWERAAAAYAGSFEAATSLFAAPLLQATGIRNSMELLDVACGAGVVTAMAASRGAVATGVDFSAAMIAEARQRHPSLTFQEADAEALPFPDCVFDAVAINFGVHHFPFPLRALSEARRVLRPRGRLAFTVWASLEENAMHRIAIDAVRAAGDPGASLPVPPSGEVNEIATCLRLLQEAGFNAPVSRAEKIEARLTLDSAQHLLDMFADGTVRTSAVIKSQPREKTAAILAAAEMAVARYREDGRLRIPATAILAVGIKQV